MNLSLLNYIYTDIFVRFCRNMHIGILLFMLTLLRINADANIDYIRSDDFKPMISDEKSLYMVFIYNSGYISNYIN